MRELLLLLALAGFVPGQVAEHANQDYRTREGRERAIRWLTGPGRNSFQKPEQLVEWMELKPGMTVADIGAGPGYMLPYLSRAVGPSGKVLAEDILPEFLDRAKAQARDEKLANVVLVLGTEKDPRLAAGSVDVALVLDSYHHFNYPSEMLASVRQAVRHDGRLILVEYHKDHFSDTAHVRLDAPDVIREVEAGGFRLISRREIEASGQYLVVFVKK
jgi:SAM-dependent methyltransferase